MNVKQYETLELTYLADAPVGSEAVVDLEAEFVLDERSTEQVCTGRDSTGQKSTEKKTWRVKGFYAGKGTPGEGTFGEKDHWADISGTGRGIYKVRFLPESAGEYHYTVKGFGGKISDRGTFTALPAAAGNHGIVRAKGIHFYYEDGTPYYGFGTTVYAFAHQTDELMNETIETLRHAPFNKIRMCVFPKHYLYNNNDPKYYAFGKRPDGSWDPDHPCFAFWDAFEKRLHQLFEIGIEVDLILFHPYDHWGFASMPLEDNLTYLDYLLRRFAAFPKMWWSMANEYDLCAAKTLDDWHGIEEFLAENDPYHHLISCHQCFHPYDVSRANITHMSWQTKQFSRIPEMQECYGKPVSIDECCYEGNLPDAWGAISGEEMTARFWRAMVRGASCTHGETFFPDERQIVWWAKGGKLVGESPSRIAFLRGILESLPAPLEPQETLFSKIIAMKKLPEEERAKAIDAFDPDFRFFVRSVLQMSEEEAARFFACETEVCGHTADDSAILHYYDIQTSCRVHFEVPENRKYRIDVIDTWNMTKETVRTDASGKFDVDLPGRPYMAVLAVEDREMEFQ